MKSDTILALAAPLLLLQGKYVRRITPRLPEAAGARVGERALGDTAGEAASLRVLITGDSSAAGVGTRHQDEALPGQLADALAARGVAARLQWQVIARSGIDTRELLAMLEESPPAPFDVAVVSIGVNDVTGRRAIGDWLDDLGRVQARLRSTERRCALVFSGLPPMHRFPALPQPLRAYLGERAREFDAALRAWVATRERASYAGIPDSDDLSLVASDGFHPGPGAYRVWAGQIAIEIGRFAGRSQPEPTRTP